VVCFSVPGVFICLTARGQNNKEPQPDGTMGFVFSGKDSADVLPFKKENKYPRWNEFDGPVSSLKLGMGFMYDYAAYKQNETSKEQVGSLDPEFRVRDFRVILSGKLKNNRDITWRAGMMYDGVTKSWLLRETGVMIHFPKISGYIFVGRTKEGYSLVKVMNGHSIWGLERPMHLDIIPILADGIKYMGYLPKPHIFMNIGAYVNWISNGQSFSTYKYQFVSRVAWLPVYKSVYEPVLHIGVNYRWGRVNDDSLTVRSKPETNEAPYFVNSGKFWVDYSNHLGGEIYFRTGPLMLGTEFNAHMMHSPQNGNPVFKGANIFALYTVTREVRPYLTTTGIFGFLKVKKTVFEGGPGAWEVMLSYSEMDLDAGSITGGKFWRLTPAIIWQLTNIYRLSFAWGTGVLEESETKGNTQFFQARFGFVF
jgi:phosphate-selective porin OprO/OprP